MRVTLNEIPDILIRLSALERQSMWPLGCRPESSAILNIDRNFLYPLAVGNLAQLDGTVANGFQVDDWWYWIDWLSGRELCCPNRSPNSIEMYCNSLWNLLTNLIEFYSNENGQYGQAVFLFLCIFQISIFRIVVDQMNFCREPER